MATVGPRKRSRLERAIVNVLASLVTAAMVAGAMVLTHAPTWAWLGIGLAVYLQQVAPTPERRDR